MSDLSIYCLNEQKIFLKSMHSNNIIYLGV